MTVREMDMGGGFREYVIYSDFLHLYSRSTKALKAQNEISQE